MVCRILLSIIADVTGAFLSGAGSCIMALAAGARYTALINLSPTLFDRGDVLAQCSKERFDGQIAEVSPYPMTTLVLTRVWQAMTQAAASCGVTGRIIITRVSACLECYCSPVVGQPHCY